MSHMRFIGEVIYCPKEKQRFRVPGLVYGEAFTCPGCGKDVPESLHHQRVRERERR